MNVFEIQYTLDKLKIPDDKPIVAFEISEYDNMELSFALCRRDFSADIYKLNLFSERLENLDSLEMTAFKSLLKAKPESDFEDILKMTYGLDSVMVYPCSGCRELGETVIENEMMPELEGCSDEILQLLDPEKVGSLMQKQDGSVFINEHYCVTSGYEPMITEEYFSDMKLIDELNYLAQKLSKLSKTDFVKLKAVMEAENKHEIYEAFYCIRDLNEYEFDINVSDQSEFGRTYLARNLSANFNISMLENMDLFDFGQGILSHNHGEVTSYGAISGRGQKLYSALTVQPEQQLEDDLEENIEEDFEPEMGGMSL